MFANDSANTIPNMKKNAGLVASCWYSGFYDGVLIRGERICIRKSGNITVFSEKITDRTEELIVCYAY